MNAPDRPDATELVEAVFEFLAEEVLPTRPITARSSARSWR